MEFQLISPEQIKKLSVAKIVTPELYDVDGYPVDGGLMDLRLGAIDPGVRCRTCGGRIKECLGHPGSIDLARSVMHLKYIPLMEVALRSFCHDCGKLMLDEAGMEKYSQTERAKKAKDNKKMHKIVDDEKETPEATAKKKTTSKKTPTPTPTPSAEAVTEYISDPIARAASLVERQTTHGENLTGDKLHTDDNTAIQKTVKPRGDTPTAQGNLHEILRKIEKRKSTRDYSDKINKKVQQIIKDSKNS